MRFVAYRVAQDPVAAEGDPADPRDRDRLRTAFERLLAEGMWAAVPTSRLDACCRRGLRVRRFADIPEDADEVVFFRSCLSEETSAPTVDTAGDDVGRPAGSIRDRDRVSTA